MRARSLAMPSSVMRPCSVSAMDPPWTGPRARPEQPDDRLLEEAALDGERARREEVVVPAGQPAERGGGGEVGEDHAEEGDAQVRDRLRLPARAARRAQALGGVEDELAGGGGGTAVTGPPLDGSAGHGARCNERTFVASRAAPSARPNPFLLQALSRLAHGVRVRSVILLPGGF